MKPFHEPLRQTLARTATIAAVVATVWVMTTGRWSAWPGIALLVFLWPSFGGHWVEVWYLNWLRPRIPQDRWTQSGARLLTWLLGGALLTLGLCATAYVLGGDPPRWLNWRTGALAFVALELVVHAVIKSSASSR